MLEDFFENDIEALDKKFQTFLKKGGNFFADEEDFENLIDFYHFSNKQKHIKLAIDKALSYYPHSGSLLLKKGIHLFELEKFREALTTLTNAFVVDKRNPQISIYLSLTYLLLGEQKKSSTYFHDALELFKMEEEDPSMSMFDAAEIIFDTIPAISDADNPFTATQPLTETEKTRVNMALELYIKIINIDNPLYTGIIHEKIAICYSILGEIDKSIRYLNEALAEEPFSQDEWLYLSINHLKLEHFDEAVEAIEYALAIQPDFDEAFYIKGHIYFSQKEYLKAIEAFKNVTSTDFDEPNIILHTIGSCYEMMDDTEQALFYYKKAFKNNPADIKTLVSLGVLYLDQKEFDTSSYYLNMAKEQEKDHPEVNYALADLMLKTKEYSKGLRYIKKSLSIEPFDTDYILLLSELYQAKGNLSKSISVLMENLNTVDEKGYVLYRLAGLFMINQKNIEATLYLKLALEEAPSLKSNFLEVFPEAKEYNQFKGLLNLPPI
jgi:tetratricopeptide (TPR) repeat protein